MGVRKKSLAEQLADIANPEPQDFDPEDFENAQDVSGSEDDSETEDIDRTSHYVDVERSKLRDDGIALSEGKYKGSKASRRDLEEKREDNEANWVNDAVGQSESDSDEDMSGGSEQSESADEEPTKAVRPETSKEISHILSTEQKHLLSRLNTDKDSDVEKGKAVSAQMKVYENLLDIRIQGQKILNATNKLSADEPQSSTVLLPLLNEVLSLRRLLAGEQVEASKEDLHEEAKATTLIDLAKQSDAMDRELARKRDSTLTKWSRKVELSSGKNALQSNKFKSLGQSAALQVNTVLADMERLTKRTKVDRSSYGLDDSHAWLFDDTDFYRLLLKDLVDRRMADSTAAAGLKWKAAASVSKQKKKVDTKASKGRKLRYNVMEKVQGFDAPRNVFTWSDKQAEDLYSGLLGVRISMDDVEPQIASDGDSDTENVRITENFNLFG